MEFYTAARLSNDKYINEDYAFFCLAENLERKSTAISTGLVVVIKRRFIRASQMLHLHKLYIRLRGRVFLDPQ